MLDVQTGPGHCILGLAQGYFVPGQPAGAPAEPNTGQLLGINRGEVMEIIGGLDRPTSFQVVGNTAYIVGLTGTVVKVDGLERAIPRGACNSHCGRGEHHRR